MNKSNVRFDCQLSFLPSTCLRIYLRRGFLGIFLQNALPNILLSIVVFSSNLYYKDRFEAAIAVNVTCLLAMSGNFLTYFRYNDNSTI